MEYAVESFITKKTKTTNAHRKRTADPGDAGPTYAIEQLPAIVQSAFSGLVESEFQGRGREVATLAGGAESTLMRVIFLRIARWHSETAARPCIVVSRHTSLLSEEVLASLLDEETAAEFRELPPKVARQRMSQFALMWRKASESRPSFPSAVDGQEAVFDVHFVVENRNAEVRFWFEIDEHVGERIERVFTPALDEEHALREVLRAVERGPDYRGMWRLIKEGAAKRNRDALAVLSDARRLSLPTHALIAAIVVLIAGGISLVASETARQAAHRVVEAADRAAQEVKKIFRGQDQSPPSPPQPRPQSPRSSPAPDARPEVHKLPAMHVTVLPPASRYLYTPSAAHDAVDIYATAPAYDEQTVRITVDPALTRLGFVEGSVKVDFGDGSSATAPVRAQSQPNLRPAATLSHAYATGNRLYKLRAEVRALMPEGGTRIVEIIEREIYVFKTKPANEPLIYESPVPEHEFDGGMWYAEPDDPRAIEYIVTTSEGTVRERRRPGRTE